MSDTVAPPTRRFSIAERVSRVLSRRRRHWTHGAWHIRQSHIFIMPNRFGLYAGFLVLASFAMGYKVQNNFILLGVIFLFLVFMLSLIASVRNLQGMIIEADIEPYYYAGERQHIRLRLKKAQPAFNITLVGPYGEIKVDLSNGAASLLVPVGAYERGVYPIASLKVQTLYPFGIARAWTWLNPPGDLVVAPKPDEQSATQYPRGNPAMAQIADEKKQQNNYADELGDLRDYQDSDPPARIDWKRFATTREMMVREHGLDAQGEMILRQPSGPLEASLSYLSGGLLVAERLGAPARMILNGADYQVYDKAAREQAYYALARAQ